MDEALPFLRTDEATHLRRLVGDAFRRAGVRVTVHDDHVQGENGMRYGLWNVAATCHESGHRRGWPAVVDRHVATLLHPPPSPADLTDEQLLASVVLRVMAADQVPDEFRTNLTYATDVAPGLLQLFVADFPHSVATLGDEEVRRVGYDRMLAAGRTRLLAEPVEHEQVVLDGGARLDVFSGDSVFVASKVLVLDDVLRGVHGDRAYPDGVLVAVPERHDLVCHVVDGPHVVAALQTLAGSTARTWAQAPASVSPSVYWWRDGALTRISRVGDDGRLAVEVHEELGEVLKRLAAT